MLVVHDQTGATAQSSPVTVGQGDTTCQSSWLAPADITVTHASSTVVSVSDSAAQVVASTVAASSGSHVSSAPSDGSSTSRAVPSSGEITIGASGASGTTALPTGTSSSVVRVGSTGSPLQDSAHATSAHATDTSHSSLELGTARPATATTTDSTGSGADSTPASKSKSNAGAIAGGVVGGLAFIALLLLALLLFHRRRQKRGRSAAWGAGREKALDQGPDRNEENAAGRATQHEHHRHSDSWSGVPAADRVSKPLLGSPFLAPASPTNPSRSSQSQSQSSQSPMPSSPMALSSPRHTFMSTSSSVPPSLDATTPITEDTNSASLISLFPAPPPGGPISSTHSSPLMTQADRASMPSTVPSSPPRQWGHASGPWPTQGLGEFGEMDDKQPSSSVGYGPRPPPRKSPRAQQTALLPTMSPLKGV